MKISHESNWWDITKFIPACLTLLVATWRVSMALSVLSYLNSPLTDPLGVERAGDKLINPVDQSLHLFEP